MVRNSTCQRVNGLPIYFSLSLSSHLLFSSSNIESTTSSLAILISIFIIQSRSLHFYGDFDLHLPHPISITPSSLSGLKDESVLSGGDRWLKTNRFGQERRWDWFDCAPQTWGRFGYDLFIFLVKVSNFWWPNWNVAGINRFFLILWLLEKPLLWVPPVSKVPQPLKFQVCWFWLNDSFTTSLR